MIKLEDPKTKIYLEDLMCTGPGKFLGKLKETALIHQKEGVVFRSSLNYF